MNQVEGSDSGRVQSHVILEVQGGQGKLIKVRFIIQQL